MYQPVPAERYFATSPALPVAQACQHDDGPGVIQALQATHASPDAVGEQGMSLLLLAMSNRSKQAMLALLTHGANPNLTTELGKSKLLVQPVAGAAKGDDPEFLRLLLTHGGDPNSHYGSRSALSCAALGDRYDNMRLLVNHGADINALDDGGVIGLEAKPIIMQLAEGRNFEQVAYLIERGANVQWKDTLGYGLAFTVQDQGFAYPPDYPRYPWVAKVKHLLEAQGVRFPVPDPAVAHTAQEWVENAQRRQWEATSEGRHWLTPIRTAERALELQQDPGPNYTRAQALRLEAEQAFQAWRKTQPHWVPSVHYINRYYQDPPTLAQEAVDMQQRQVRFQADSIRWAQQAQALR